MRQAVSSETIDYNKPLSSRSPVRAVRLLQLRLHHEWHTTSLRAARTATDLQDLFVRLDLHKDPYSPEHKMREGDAAWDADVLLRYHSSKDGEYR